jgi:hypothetical protein
MSYRGEIQGWPDNASAFLCERESLLRELRETKKLLFTRLSWLLLCAVLLVVPYAFKQFFFDSLSVLLQVGYGLIVLGLLVRSRGLVGVLKLCHKVYRTKKAISDWDDLETDLNSARSSND